MPKEEFPPSPECWRQHPSKPLSVPYCYFKKPEVYTHWHTLYDKRQKREAEKMLQKMRDHPRCVLTFPILHTLHTFWEREEGEGRSGRGGGASPAYRSQRGPWGRRRLIRLPLVPSLSWAEDQGQRRVCEVGGREQGVQGQPVQFLTQATQRGHPHPKIPSPYEQADYTISDGIQALRPCWGPPEVAKIKGQGPWWEREWGDSLCGCPYLGLTLSFSPQSLPAKWREERKRDWIG